MPLPPLTPEDIYGGAHQNDDHWLVAQEIPPYMPTTVPVDITQGGTSAITVTDALDNLGIGTAAEHPDTYFLQTSNNLSDVNNRSTSRTNLGLAIGTNVEAWSPNLDTYTTKTPPAGSVVGTTDTQTLTNKTLTTPTIADYTNAQHNHTNAAQGGTLSFAQADASALANYSGGDIALGASNDTSFSDVDATNAKLSVPVTVPGTWQVIFSFATNVSSTISLSLSTSTAFQLTDGTNTTPAINTGTTLPLSLALVTSNVTPQTLIGTFVWSTSGTKTVKLQKKNITSGNIGSRVVSANSNSPIAMVAYRISN